MVLYRSWQYCCSVWPSCSSYEEFTFSVEIYRMGIPYILTLQGDFGRECGRESRRSTAIAILVTISENSTRAVRLKILFLKYHIWTSDALGSRKDYSFINSYLKYAFCKVFISTEQINILYFAGNQQSPQNP